MRRRDELLKTEAFTKFGAKVSFFIVESKHLIYSRLTVYKMKPLYDDTWIENDSLFGRLDLYRASHDSKGQCRSFGKMSPYRRRIKSVDNLHLVGSMLFSDTFAFPIVEPFMGPVDYEYVAFKDRKKHFGHGKMLGCFQHDHTFDGPLWGNLERTIHEIIGREYSCMIGPDYSFFVNPQLRTQSVYNLYKSRFITAYAQKCGLPVIPVATWGGIDTYKFCFESLPMHSVVAVCGIGHDRTLSTLNLWKEGIKELVIQLAPLKILVYGGKRTLIEGVDVEIIFIEDYINQVFRK